MFRFSLATFLITVTLVSLVIAGLRFPNDYWMRVIGTTTLAVLALTTISAVVSQRSSRWFWIGFSMVGWGYLALGFFGNHYARDTLLTHSALRHLDRTLGTSKPFLAPNGEEIVRDDDTVWVRSERTERLSVKEAKQQGYIRYAYTDRSRPRPQHFYDIGHYAWALLLGAIGGTFSLWVYRKEAKTRG